MDDARSALTARLGARPLHQIVVGGYTLMEHWLVELADGTRAFAKVAVDEPTAGFLRDEHRIYTRIDGAFLPRFLDWDDDGARPILVLEDLTDAYWPPPWRSGDVELVRDALAEIHALPPPDGLHELVAGDLHAWREVEDDPAPFLGLGLCSAEWLEQTLPELIAATDRCDVGGDAFVHLDVRSDNICIADGQAKLVDWNWASVGNPRVDFAFWLATVSLEGGPSPAELMPDAGDLTAVVSGFFAPIAGLPPPAGAPKVRSVQLAQLQVALPWAVDVLGLPPLDR
jgi:hypothetical protein